MLGYDTKKCPLNDDEKYPLLDDYEIVQYWIFNHRHQSLYRERQTLIIQI